MGIDYSAQLVYGIEVVSEGVDRERLWEYDLAWKAKHSDGCPFTLTDVGDRMGGYEVWVLAGPADSLSAGRWNTLPMGEVFHPDFSDSPSTETLRGWAGELDLETVGEARMFFAMGIS